tara:strand:+ start:32060 stop:33256 length:1197 start_codon:yes stop_codon:yes gene_type:complete
MQLCFFSDQIAKNFLPLTLTRPVFDLRVGVLTIREKWEHYLGIKFISGIYEEYLYSVFKSNPIKEDEDCIWINSRFLPSDNLMNSIKALEPNQALSKGGKIIAAKISGTVSALLFENRAFNVDDLKKKEIDLELKSISFFWDLLSLNGDEITSDLKFFDYKPVSAIHLNGESIFKNTNNIFIADNAIIEPGCIIMAEKGPVFIGSNAIIEAGSILKGPVAICEGSTVKIRARIYDNTTIGPVCKVGGEVSNSIFHSYSNKSHDGFTGSSLVGQWCNFGADSNTSNLKNSYGEVKIFDWTTKTEYEKGFQFFGTILGDHSKTAIDTVLNTGTTCGVCSNIFSLGFPPRYIPSFSWMGQKETTKYNFDKAIIAMSAMMKRRGIELSDEYKQMMKVIAESS